MEQHPLPTQKMLQELMEKLKQEVSTLFLFAPTSQHQLPFLSQYHIIWIFVCFPVPPSTVDLQFLDLGMLPAGYAGHCFQIGVALDFSKGSKKALGWVIDILLDKGDTLIVLHILPTRTLTGPNQGDRLRAWLCSELWKQQQPGGGAEDQDPNVSTSFQYPPEAPAPQLGRGHPRSSGSSSIEPLSRSSIFFDLRSDVQGDLDPSNPPREDEDERGDNVLK